MVFGLVAGAWAADPAGFWYPDDLAALSTLYTTSSEKLQAPFGEREAGLERSAAAIREYRVGLDLLGATASAAERERLDRLEAAHAKNHATLGAFANRLIGDYDAAFTGAVERAATPYAGIVECEAEVAAAGGPRIPGAPTKRVANPTCQGPNRNPALAAAVDADAAARAAIDEILTRPWPELAPLDSAPQPAGDRWISVVDLMQAGARSSLTAILMQDEEARDAIEAAMEAATSQVELDALKPKVDAIEAVTAQRRADLASPVLAAVSSRLTKWKEPATGFCANPRALGGCAGTDVSKDLVSRLIADKKVVAALSSGG